MILHDQANAAGEIGTCLADLVTEETELKKIEDRIHKINPNAPIIRCQQSKVDWKKIIGLGAFDLDRVLVPHSQASFHHMYITSPLLCVNVILTLLDDVTL